MLIIYCMLLKNIYSEPQLSFLYNGIDKNNNVILMISQTICYSAYSFFIFGEQNKYINGYGKYILLRTHKRSSIFFRIIFKNSFSLFFLESLKIAFFFLINALEVNIDFNVFIMSLIIHLCTYTALIMLQIFFEIILGSKIALLISIIYYILSCIVGGILIEKGFQIQMILFIPNYSMNFRNKYFFKTQNSNTILLLILISIITILLFASKKALKNKDIF